VLNRFVLDRTAATVPVTSSPAVTSIFTAGLLRVLPIASTIVTHTKARRCATARPSFDKSMWRGHRQGNWMRDTEDREFYNSITLASTATPISAMPLTHRFGVTDTNGISTACFSLFA